MRFLKTIGKPLFQSLGQNSFNLTIDFLISILIMLITRTGSTPFTGNVVVPPYVIERVEGDDSDAIMMITKISGGFHGGGWIVKAPRRSGYSEQLEAGGGPSTNDNFYGAFYNAELDTLCLPQSMSPL